MQNRQFRTSCGSKVIHRCWKRLVLYIATARLVKFIFKSEQLHALPPSLTQKKNKNNKRDDSQDADDCLRDLPEWLEEFTDNPEDTELLGSAHSSPASDSERLRKSGMKIKEGTTFVLTSQETIIVGSARERRSQGTLAEGEVANQYHI